MILSKEVEVKISPKNIAWFENKGYIIPRYKDSHYRWKIKRGTKIWVKVKDLPPKSMTLVKCSCETCGLIFLLPFQQSHRKNCKNCHYVGTGKDNRCWRGGKPHCKICGKLLTDYNAVLCKKCLCKENSPVWKGGKPKCIDCGKTISYGKQRCIGCWGKQLRGDKNPRWNLDKTEFQKYRIKVNTLTRKNKKQLFEDWDGKDYYNCRDINNLPKKDITIDHKISVKYGFDNNISVEEISNINNLCICSRKSNCCKWNLNSDDYILSKRFFK